MPGGRDAPTDTEPPGPSCQVSSGVLSRRQPSGQVVRHVAGDPVEPGPGPDDPVVIDFRVPITRCSVGSPP